ncbi:M90 family metallopeptidase [Zeimonas arvi]
MLKRLFGRPAPAAADLDHALWRETLAAMPWLGHLDAAGLARLRELSAGFLAAKTITGAAGFEVDDRVRVAIAAQACLPILKLGLAAYDDFVEIVVYPDRFLVSRSQVDEAGVVHESTDELAGEAMERGPVVLSWPDADPNADADPASRGWNVVIHEFAHKLDMLDGEPDGVPPLPARRRAAWTREIEGAWESFCGMLDRLEESIPRHVDPESPQGEAWYASLPLDPYAATDVGEFFAVAAEAFFVDPEPLAEVFPDLYRLLTDYFGQDPRSAVR